MKKILLPCSYDIEMCFKIAILKMPLVRLEAGVSSLANGRMPLRLGENLCKPDREPDLGSVGLCIGVGSMVGKFSVPSALSERQA